MSGILGFVVLVGLAVAAGWGLRAIGRHAANADTLQPTGIIPTVNEPPESMPEIISPVATPQAASTAPTVSATPILSAIPESSFTPVPALLFVADQVMYWLPAGESLTQTAAQLVPLQLGEAGEYVVGIFPSPDRQRVILFTHFPPPKDEAWKAYVWDLRPDQAPREVMGYAEFGWGSKFFGWYPDNRQIVYWEDGAGVFLQDVDTGKRTLVTSVRDWATYLPSSPQVDAVAVSPDGRSVILSFVWFFDEHDQWEVWRGRIDGSGAEKLFTSAATARMSWSPDGKWIALVEGGNVVVMPADGDGQSRRPVGRRYMGGLDPGWSPDGRYLVFDARNDTPSAPSRELPEADKGKGAMDFSPFTIQIVDVAQGMERALTPDTVGGEVAPAWSPDGWRVAFLSDRSGAIEVWVIDADGNNLQQVTFDSRARVTAPAWVSLMIQDKP